ncbi:C-type lectin mannose-binding isoform-like [Ostrea edulis]|uniref:C-type lectin mannose-binding isoform-like n=1 Tax=Ostrea edulis TaxID=37623 RepID=UPI0020941BA8|nr:C-type lectin mannose-binding isoform-like [Ostrea edulis]
MQHFLFSFCVLLSCLSLLCTFKQSSEFFRVANNDNKYPTTNIVKEIVQIFSLTSCSAICTKRGDCSSFFYNGILQRCVCTGPTDQQALQSSLGYIHFSSTETFSWIVFGKSQYLHTQSYKFWLDAQIECRKLGAKLAEIETPEENIFLKNIARQNGYGNVYIGGTEALKPNTWIWFTTLSPIFVTDWADGRPQNLPADDFCLALTDIFDYKWDDWGCHIERFTFICEREFA